MKNFIKNNIVLVLGVTLPILLSVFFLIANEIPKYFVEDPKYSMIFAGSGYYEGGPYTFKVENGKLKISYNPPQNMSDNYKPPVPKLYKFDPAHNAVSAIEFSTSSFNKVKPSEIILRETENLTIDSNATAPDGYAFVGYYSEFNRGLAMDIFFSGGHSFAAIIEKENRKVKIPASQKYPYYYGDVHFIGWVVKETGK